MRKYFIRVSGSHYAHVNHDKSVSLNDNIHQATMLDLLDISKLVSQIVKSGKYQDKSLEVVSFTDYVDSVIVNNQKVIL